MKNSGDTKATNIKLFFYLDGVGDSLSLKTTYQIDASILSSETPIIGQKGQLIEIDHIAPNSYEVIVVSGIKATSSSDLSNKHNAHFIFRSLSYAGITKPITQADQISFQQIRRAAKSKSNINRFKIIESTFKVLTRTTLHRYVEANPYGKLLPDIPWFEEEDSFF